jgi:predicted DNA-binding transcriptional regulator YafY
LVEESVISRAVRLARIQHLLYTHPKGLASRELARLCGVSMRTIQRDLIALQSELKIPLAQNGKYYSILESYVLPPVSLSLYEAMAAFLVLRLALRQTDKENPHIRSTLTKIAALLPPPLARDIEASIASGKKSAEDPDRTRIFEQVALAWTARRQIKISYQSLQSDEVKEWLLEPYFVEMTGIGYSSYVIGHAVREGKEGIITFKLDRVRQAEVLDTSFEIPTDFDISRLLSSAWGVIWGEETRVKLKFSPTVSRRVKESVWHPSQQLEDLPDGGVVMTLYVGSILEITPWVRSWGADVEVLEPKSLREALRQQAILLTKIYQPRRRST